MATDTETDEPRARIRELVEGGETDRATDRVLEVWGDDLYNYIRRISCDRSLAQDAFQECSMDIWRGLESFGWNSSLETWLYTVARNATYDLMRKRDRRDVRPFRTDEQRELVANWTRTVTKNFEKTEAKEWLWEVIEEFDSEDRELLVLRVGHRKPWKEVARIVEDGDLEDDELRRASARLRKRYQRVKESLRERRDEFDG